MSKTNSDGSASRGAGRRFWRRSVLVVALSAPPMVFAGFCASRLLSPPHAVAVSDVKECQAYFRAREVCATKEGGLLGERRRATLLAEKEAFSEAAALSLSARGVEGLRNLCRAGMSSVHSECPQ